MTDYKDFIFTIYDDSGDRQSEKNNTNETKEENFDTKSTQPITALSGNLNVDISISPYKNTILSGNDAIYNLVFKVTGSKKEYKNARIVVNLPITNYTSFSQNLSELKINDVTPTYNASTHQLIYQFNSIKSGRSYETIIKVNTKNGESPHNAQLKATASFQAENQSEITDSATVTINASSGISVTKQYKETRSSLNGTVQKAPFPGSYTIWDIKVSIPKKNVGQMFLKEGSKIVITDTFPSGLTYVNVLNNTPAPSVSGRTLTWEFNAPTLAQQKAANGELYTINLRVALRVGNNNSLVNTTQTNNASAKATFIDSKTTTSSASATITIVNADAGNGTVTGTWYIPNHFGPSNGNGGVGTLDQKNPNPVVYDDALLRFDHGIAPLEESKYGNFQKYTTVYKIDPNLIFVKLKTPGGFMYRPNSSYPTGIPLAEQPRFNIVATVNGQERTLVVNAQINKEYTRKDLGLSNTDVVSVIKYDFTYAPSGMLNNGVPRYYFEVKKGYTGQVKNTFNIVGVAGNGQSFNKNYDTADINTINGPRTATIVSKASAPAPIGEIAIELLDQNGGEVLRGGNRMKITFKNSSSSTVTITEPLEAVVLLPLGVTLKSNPNATYTDKNGQSSTGNYQILNNNYNGTGRQLVKIKWNDDRIRIGGNLTAELDVNISNSAPNSLQFDVYGFSGNNALRVPTSSGTNITNTVLQTDTDDLNKDNKTNTPRLKSGNIYTIRGHYDIQTEKLVKGALDSDFTYFGHTTPGGSIEYKIRLTNTTGKNITELTLIDVLPSVGDLGITDNITRDSQFTPIMTNSIVLPTQWQNKVNVYYSTAKKPKRDDLTKNTIYPDTTTQLSNPAGAENPNWKTAAQVTDWSSIHSFKIELKDGVEWLNGQNIEIQFQMQAPSELKVNRDVLDKTINPTERAAWNSFAVATDHGQPVEPMRVGVYMDYDIEDPKVEKTVNDSKNPLELNDRNELFTWKIDYDFGNYTGNWNSVVLSDQIHELLTIESVKVVNQVGQDVTTNGTVNITNNLVTFTLNKQNNSFNYLKGQTYTLIIESKIKQSATDDQLGPYIQSGGIPNQAKLVVDNNPTNSNEVKVIPPILGEVQITKVDDKTRGVLEGAQFELRKCPNEHSSVDDCVLVSSGTSDTNGKISFKDIKMGYYKLVETKAPEGYRILTKPIDIPLLDIHNRVLTIEVENSQNGWELPSSGGMGTYPFYILGAVLMIGSVFMLKKRKKAK